MAHMRGGMRMSKGVSRIEMRSPDMGCIHMRRADTSSADMWSGEMGRANMRSAEVRRSRGMPAASARMAAACSRLGGETCAGGETECQSDRAAAGRKFPEPRLT